MAMKWPKHVAKTHTLISTFIIAISLEMNVICMLFVHSRTIFSVTDYIGVR